MRSPNRRLSIFAMALFMLLCGHGRAIALSTVLVSSAESLAGLSGTPIGEIAVLRFQQGVFESIAFQVDERVYNDKNKQYQYLLQDYNKQAVGNAAQAIFDGQDQLVYMSGDGGALAPSTPPLERAYRLTYRISGQSRYVYVGRVTKNTPVPASTRYVEYDPVADIVKTSKYETQFLPEAPFAQGTLILKNGKVPAQTSVLDRFKMRFHLDLRAFFNINLKEGDITSKRIGYHLGPIRLIRRLVVYQKLGPIRVTPKAISDYVFSQAFIHIPSIVVTPFDPKAHLNADSMGFGAFDFSEQFFGSFFYADHNTVPVVLDGKMSAQEQALERRDVKWWVVSGDKGHFAVRVRLDPALERSDIEIGLHYQDDVTVALPPENEKGQSSAGFELNLRDLPQGRFVIHIEQFFPDQGFRIGDERPLFELGELPPVETQSL